MTYKVAGCPKEGFAFDWQYISDAKIKFKKGELRLNIDPEFVEAMPQDLKEAVCEKKVAVEAEDPSVKDTKFDVTKFRDLMNGRTGFYIRNDKAEGFANFLNEKRESMWLDRIFEQPKLDAMPDDYFGVSADDVHKCWIAPPKSMQFSVGDIDHNEWLVVGEPLNETFVAQLRAQIRDCDTDDNFLRINGTSTYLVKKDEALQKKIEAALDIVRNNVKDGVDPRFKTNDIEMLKFAFRERKEIEQSGFWERQFELFLSFGILITLSNIGIHYGLKWLQDRKNGRGKGGNGGGGGGASVNDLMAVLATALASATATSKSEKIHPRARNSFQEAIAADRARNSQTYLPPTLPEFKKFTKMAPALFAAAAAGVFVKFMPQELAPASFLGGRDSIQGIGNEHSI